MKKARKCKNCFYSANGSNKKLYCTRSILEYTTIDFCCVYFREKEDED